MFRSQFCLLQDAASFSLGEGLLDAACTLSLDADVTAQKVAVSVLTRMVTVCGEWAEKAARTVLSLPLAFNFDLKDAASVLVSGENFVGIAPIRSLDCWRKDESQAMNKFVAGCDLN